MFKLKSSIFLLLCFIFTGCISTKTSDRYRAKGIDPRQEQRVTYQGQFLTDIVGIFIEQQTGLSPSLVLSITNGSTVNYVNRKFEKIEKYKEEEYLLNQELLSLREELNNLKIEYRALQRSLSNIEDLRESKRRELKSLNNKYRNSVESYKTRLVSLERHIKSSNKILKKQPLLNKIREYTNELDSL